MIFEVMSVIDSCAERRSWLADDNVTLADLSIFCNVTQIKACGYNTSKHIHLSRWLEQCEHLPGYEECLQGAEETGKYFKNQIPNGFKS